MAPPITPKSDMIKTMRFDESLLLDKRDCIVNVFVVAKRIKLNMKVSSQEY